MSESPDVESPHVATAAVDARPRDADTDALLSRLRVIEDQPLESRAEQLAQVYEELRAMLETGDARPSA